MKNIIKTKITSWFTEQDGVTAIEYGLIMAGVSMAVLVGVTVFSGDFISMQEVITTYIDGNTDSSPSGIR